MRNVSFTAAQFRDFVFPFVATGRATNDDALECALRLLRKLKDPALTVEVPLTPEERVAQESGVSVYKFRQLLEDSALFAFEEDEFRLLSTRIRDSKTSVQFVALEVYMDLLKRLDDAKQSTESAEV